MRLPSWKAGLVADYRTAFDRASTGAAYLDKRFGPKWDQAIDPGKLDIGSMWHCVIAQLGRQGYHFLTTPQHAINCGFSCGLLVDSVALFYRSPDVERSFELLRDAWRQVLRQRRDQSDISASLAGEPAFTHQSYEVDRLRLRPNPTATQHRDWSLSRC